MKDLIQRIKDSLSNLDNQIPVDEQFKKGVEWVLLILESENKK